ncbi:MAG: type II toxin-antitoxin system VapC family toxin [Janthinobacterium lividum]
MLILDTDHLSILERDTIEAFNLGRRLAPVPPEEVAVTIITYEEQMRGWFAYITQARTTPQQIEAYQRLRRFITQYSRINLIDYDAEAGRQFDNLRTAKVRIGTKDLQIAAICLANNATLLTRNLKHFSQVPGLNAEDWSV